MSRRDWWLGVAVIVLAMVVLHAFPRYDVRFVNGNAVRVDRWTGSIARAPRTPMYLDERGEPLPPGQAH